MSGLLIHRISFIFHADAPDVPTNTHRSVASPSRARRGQLDPPAPFVRLPIPAQRTTGSSNAKEGDAIGICQGDGYNHDHERHQEPQAAASPDAARRARGMTAAPWFVRTKLLLYAALGFLLGVAVTVSFMGSTPSLHDAHRRHAPRGSARALLPARSRDDESVSRRRPSGLSAAAIGPNTGNNPVSSVVAAGGHGRYCSCRCPSSADGCQRCSGPIPAAGSSTTAAASDSDTVNNQVSSVASGGGHGH
jgi:hypothetical protein